MRTPPVVALEIGTTKVTALVGEMREDSYMMITGRGECASRGMRKGDVVDVGDVVACARTALDMAEASSKVSIRVVIVGMSGAHIQSLSNRGTLPVMGADGIIGGEDMEKVQELAEAINLPADREVLHSVSQHYHIDDQECVVRPEGMSGARLSHDMLVVHGLRSRRETLVRAVQGVPISVDDVVFSGIGSAIAVLSPEQKRSGVAVIDLGGGTSDYVVYSGSAIVAAGSIGVGGDHVSNDISVAFHISSTQAERLKKETGSAVTDGVSRSQRVSMPPEVGFPGRSVNLHAMQTVIHVRMMELLATIRTRLEQDDVLSHLGAGIVLTGGGTHLKGVCDLAETVFELPCSIGRPRGVTGVATVTDGPEYATCAGLVQYGFRAYQEAQKEAPLRRWFKGLFGR